MHEIGTADDARIRVRRLIGPGSHLPNQTRHDILDLGLAAVPALLEILADEKLALSESTGDGWAPAHAARLLGELKAEQAVEPMLRTLAGTDPLDVLHDQVLQALPNIGAPALEPALLAYKEANPELQTSIASVLSRIRVRDERIFEILVAQLRREPGYAGNMADYGDPRAAPYLREALDKYEPVQGDNPFANHALIELREAIERLGGTLSAEQQLKCRRGLQQAEGSRRDMLRFFEAKRRDAPSMPVTPARTRDLPGRNDPCWCGSGMKYKRCHLASDQGRFSGAQ
jgi:hypothetical protein